MQLSELQYLMGQLGPATSDILRIVQHNEDQWQVELDAGLSLQIVWQPNKSCVIFSCSLGSVTLTEREQVYSRLLNANLQLTGLSDARLALSEPDQEVMLIGEYAISASSMDPIQQALREFLHLAMKYAELIACPSQAEVPMPLPLVTTGAGLGVQRV